jgi:hypothetical protein
VFEAVPAPPEASLESRDAPALDRARRSWGE